jgi:hypothetical protein
VIGCSSDAASCEAASLCCGASRSQRCMSTRRSRHTRRESERAGPSSLTETKTNVISCSEGASAVASATKTWSLTRQVSLVHALWNPTDVEAMLLEFISPAGFEGFL